MGIPVYWRCGFSLGRLGIRDSDYTHCSQGRNEIDVCSLSSRIIMLGVRLDVLDTF